MGVTSENRLPFTSLKDFSVFLALVKGGPLNLEISDNQNDRYEIYITKEKSKI